MCGGATVIADYRAADVMIRKISGHMAAAIKERFARVMRELFR